MDEAFDNNPDVKDCCKQPDNLVEVPAEGHPLGDLILRVCKECGCRHFELSVDPGELGLHGSGI